MAFVFTVTRRNSRKISFQIAEKVRRDLLFSVVFLLVQNSKIGESYDENEVQDFFLDFIFITLYEGRQIDTILFL